MKFIQIFILLFIIQFSKIFNIKIKLPNTGDLRRKLFLTNHAINKLKGQISIRLEKNKRMQNYEKNNNDTITISIIDGGILSRCGIRKSKHIKCGS